MTKTELFAQNDNESRNRLQKMILKDDSSLQQTDEVTQSESEEIEGQMLNPELIGASHALKDNDLVLYDQIMSGKKSINVEDLMKLDIEAAGGKTEDIVDSDSEMAIELGKFDDSAYKANPERLAESQTLDRMVKFDKTFKMVMDHVRKLLKISHVDLNRHI